MAWESESQSASGIATTYLALAVSADNCPMRTLEGWSNKCFMKWLCTQTMWMAMLWCHDTITHRQPEMSWRVVISKVTTNHRGTNNGAIKCVPACSGILKTTLTPVFGRFSNRVNTPGKSTSIKYFIPVSVLEEIFFNSGYTNNHIFKTFGIFRVRLDVYIVLHAFCIRGLVTWKSQICKNAK